MIIIPWGVRGTLPTTDTNKLKFGGNTTCFEIKQKNTPIIIIDAGTGIHNFNFVLPDECEIHLFITHFHLANIQGLPFFKPLFNPKCTVHFYTTKNQKNLLEKVFDGCIFPVTLDQLSCTWTVTELDPEKTINIGELTINNIIVPQTKACHGLRIRGSKSIACFVNDIKISDNDVLKQIEVFIENADVAFLSGRYAAEEEELHKYGGYVSLDILPTLAVKANVKKLILCCHPPTINDSVLEGMRQYLQAKYVDSVKIDMAHENISYTVLDNEDSQDQKMHSLVKWIANFSRELLLYDDISTILDRILLEARKITDAEAGTIFLENNNKLFFAFTHNDKLFHVDNAHQFSYSNVVLPIDTTSIAGYCAHTKTVLNFENVYKLPRNLPFSFNGSLDKLTNFNTVSMLCLPLIGKQGRLLGIIQLINSVKDGEVVPFLNYMYEKMTILIIQAVNSIERSLLAKEMIHKMQVLAEINDPKETNPHVERIGAVAAELYNAIATMGNVPIEERRVMRNQIRLAAMLHDIGKISVPEKILQKPGKLTNEEILLMQTHCSNSKHLFLATNKKIDQMASSIAMHHHQKWNGKGYTGDPKTPKLAGDAIPLVARIVAVADVFDALVSVRCYKAAWTWEDAVNIIKKDAGTHFDPQVVKAFLQCESIIKAIYEHYVDIPQEATS